MSQHQAPLPESPSPLSWLQDEVAELRQRNLWRTPEAIAPPQAPLVAIGEEQLLLFSSNNYLGLASDPRLGQAAAQAAAAFGTGSGASRLVTGTQPLHLQLEAALAGLKGTEDAVLFSSGYLANLGTIAALVGKPDAIVSDAWNHASIIDGCRLSGAQILVYPHKDLEACGRHLRSARAAGKRRILLATDSVFSMDGDLAPLTELLGLARRYQAMMLVDEAHATGVLGDGRGALSMLGLSQEVDVVIGTCSKALGSLGGFAAGTRELCDYLKNRARSFVFDTAPPPPVLAATRCALDIVATEKERGYTVLRHAQRLYEGLSQLGFTVLKPAAAIVPVMLGEADRAVRLAAALRRRGVLALPIRPPTVPPGTARLRLCPMATHSDADIEKVRAAFAELSAEAESQS